MNRLTMLVRQLWRWLLALLRRLLGLPVSAPVTLEGTAGAVNGAVAGAMLAWPRRKYLLRLPAGYQDRNGPDDRHHWPLLVWIHGCKQSPEDLIALSGIGAQADRRQLLVLAPRQSRLANPLRCWNWFDPNTASGAGEAAIIAAQIDRVCRDHRVDPARIYVGGLSSGAALTAVLAVRMPARFAGAAVVAGIACGAATSALTVNRVLTDGPQGDMARVGELARQSAGGQCQLPVIIVQGMDDDVVPPMHADALVTQMLALNGDTSASTQPASQQSTPTPGFAVTTDDYRIGGQLLVRRLSIAGLGHAWSGALPGPRFGEPAGPDATGAILDFFGLPAR